MDILRAIWAWIKAAWTRIIAKVSLGGELVWVLLGGALGGALAPAVVLMLETESRALRVSLGSLWDWFFGPSSSTNMAMGAIAAGITVYVVSKRDKDPVKALFFFSVICGLTFQSILTAVTPPDKKEEQAIDKSGVAVAAAQTSDGDVAAVSTAATVAIEAINEAPADKVDASTRAEVGANIIETVTGLEAARQSAPDSDQSKYSDAIEDIQDAARKNGYDALIVPKDATGTEAK
jgi:hypothetical protein